MTHVVCEACINCKRTDCVDVCPVDCFHEGPNFLAIDPDECIDCAVCVPECPEGAIFAEEDVPADQLDFIQINAELSHQWWLYGDLSNQGCACTGRCRQRYAFEIGRP